MGRKYYCDFCDKRIQIDSVIIKKHTEGLPHLRAKAEHFEQFKDLEQIIHESKSKTPCRSLQTGNECIFGALCRFGHYTDRQLWEIQQHLEKSKSRAAKECSKRLYLRMHNVTTRTHNFTRKRIEKYEGDRNEPLPPSMQLIKYEIDPECPVAEWGRNGDIAK